MPSTLTQKREIPYTKQAKFDYCGPACALMVLSYLGELVAETEIEKETHQHTLFDIADKLNNPNDPLNNVDEEILEEWAGWTTTPQEMVNMLHTAPQGTGNILITAFSKANIWVNYFATAEDTDQNRGNFLAALRAITKDETEKPPAIVPVHDWSHWVVLSQYAENTTQDGKVFKSFVGHDPISESAKIEKEDGSYSYQGIINLADNPLNFESQTNFLLVQDTNNQNNAILRPAAATHPAAPIDLPPNPIALAAAQSIAKQRLKEFGVTNPCLSGRHLSRTVPGVPYHVKRLDRPDGTRDYYLIGMQNEASKENRLLLRLDILTGSYLDSLTIPPTRYLLDKPRYDAVLIERTKKQLNPRQPLIPNAKQRWINAFERTLVNLDAPLVWRPCKESPSAFYPFFDVKENNTTLFYVRIDGKVFPALTPLLKPPSLPLP
jgi:hypothetical protein